jgi:hypothetical protein
VTRWLLASLCAAGAAVAIQPTAASTGWPWRLLAEMVSPSLAISDGLSTDSVLAAVPAQALFGPLILLAFQLGLMYRQRTIHGQEWSRYVGVERHRKALEPGWPGPQGDGNLAAQGHPPGQIRLGLVADRRPFDLGADEIAQHVFIPGATGTGKTTTLITLADGALANGYAVVIIDCKGVGLAGQARKLALRHGVPFTVVDPVDPKTLGYDPCSGDAPTIANKLVGAFSFSAEAEIYKQVAMEVIPVICRAMDAAGMAITLEAIYDALGKGGLSELGRKKGAARYRDRLNALEESGGVGPAGYVGFQKRLGALIEGSFGDLYRKRPALDWQRVMASPQVVYISLTTTATGEDVELFARVITNDLKQVCAQRMRSIDAGENPIPVLVIYDEFAALREASQITDLLLQARQARAPLVIATQYLPQDPAIRQPALSAGVLIVHRLEAKDADAIAAQFGTRKATEVTAQINYDEGTSEKGSVRQVEEYIIHPNELKMLPVGRVAVYARRSNRRELVQVNRLT